MRNIHDLEYEIIEDWLVKECIEQQEESIYDTITLSREEFLISAMVSYNPIHIYYIDIKPIFNSQLNNFEQSKIKSKYNGKNIYTY